MLAKETVLTNIIVSIFTNRNTQKINELEDQVISLQCNVAKENIPLLSSFVYGHQLEVDVNDLYISLNHMTSSHYSMLFYYNRFLFKAIPFVVSVASAVAVFVQSFHCHCCCHMLL